MKNNFPFYGSSHFPHFHIFIRRLHKMVKKAETRFVRLWGDLFFEKATEIKFWCFQIVNRLHLFLDRISDFRILRLPIFWFTHFIAFILRRKTFGINFEWRNCSLRNIQITFPISCLCVFFCRISVFYVNSFLLPLWKSQKQIAQSNRIL